MHLKCQLLKSQLHFILLSSTSHPLITTIVTCQSLPIKHDTGKCVSMHKPVVAIGKKSLNGTHGSKHRKVKSALIAVQANTFIYLYLACSPICGGIHGSE